MEMHEMSLLQQLIYYNKTNAGYILQQFGRHFLISVYGVVFAAIVGIPLGIFIAKKRRLAPWVLNVCNIIQTIPSLAMVSSLMLVIGLGAQTVVLANFLYALLPIILNTYTGMRNLPEDVLDAAKGIGMTKGQRLWRVELPLSLSVIMGGIRNALVLTIGVTAIGSFIGAGGLGDIIIRGTNATNGTAIILSGAIPTALMAILADLFLAWAERFLQDRAQMA